MNFGETHRLSNNYRRVDSITIHSPVGQLEGEFVVVVAYLSRRGLEEAAMEFTESVNSIPRRLVWEVRITNSLCCTTLT